LLELTAVEYDILEYLVRAANRLVGRDELAAMLYQRESTPYERTLDVHVSHIRTKLGDNNHVLIRTVRGAGYIFTGGEQS
jgi:two-component system response regulator CpxR